LRKDTIFVGLFAYDEMLQSPMLLRPIEPEPPEGFVPRPMDDTDVGYLQEALQTWFPRLSKDCAHQACDMVAQERRYHPVRGYLESLVWDGKKRVATWLHRYMGAANNEYTARIGEMFLISMVARVYRPGVQCDHMIVFEGEQGAMKTSACRVLGGQWFSENLPELTAGTDISSHLKGKWLVEIDELGAMSRADVNRFKGFLSRTVERYRPKYGRKDVHEARQVVFAGTTNESAYLRDTTGNRRFWPVRTGVIDISALKRDRDMIFAEAVTLFRKGVQWWPNKDFENKLIQPEQDARLEADVIDEPIAELLAKVKAEGGSITLGEVAVRALGAETLRIGTGEQWQIRRAMQRLGWTSGKMDGKGRRVWVPKRQ
jgi:predicted P-loop ATPase